jgi:hypothetical protein
LQQGYCYTKIQFIREDFPTPALYFLNVDFHFIVALKKLFTAFYKGMEKVSLNDKQGAPDNQ